MSTTDGTSIAIQVSVTELVDFSCRYGDLVHDTGPGPNALNAIRAHQRLQRARPEGYQPEVPVSCTIERGNITLTVAGRMDGLLVTDDEILIEEIKTLLRNMNDLPQALLDHHLAQAKLYGYLYCRDKGYERATLRMTYFRLDAETEEHLEHSASLEELEAFFTSAVETYLAWLTELAEHRQRRDASIRALEFPHGTYRPGQRRFAVAVYRTIADKGQLLAQAPTGIGKTVSTLFPAIKAMGEGHVDSIVFLTAKTPGRFMAEQAMRDMVEKGLRARALTLTAKDKICFEEKSEQRSCLPEDCPFSRGFYDRLPAARRTLFCSLLATREVIETVAREHQICPFEFSLEMARWSDVLIGDYNYLFSPSAAISFLTERPDRRRTVLIDEAHNLIDRARDLFSASLTRQRFLDLERDLRGQRPGGSRGQAPGGSRGQLPGGSRGQLPGVRAALKGIAQLFLRIRKRSEAAEDGFVSRGKVTESGEGLRDEARYVSTDKPGALQALSRFCEIVGALLINAGRQQLPPELLETYFDVLAFLRVLELFDESYRVVVTTQKKGRRIDVDLMLFCLDPSTLLAKAFKLVGSAVLFSATLEPREYFAQLLGLGKAHRFLALPSPFPRERLGVFVAQHIAATFRQRQSSLPAVAEAIGEVVLARSGRYLVFFPSYAYLDAVLELCRPGLAEVEVVRQVPEMSEEARETFLERFREDASSQKTLLGFAIMGGLFGEGIDLPGESLVGAMVVSVGLPQLCLERDLIREHFETRGQPGFEYAYQYPGMNRVLQTAGRVIRSESDRGVVILADYRFCESRYRRLYPAYWEVRTVRSGRELRTHLDAFWAGD